MRYANFVEGELNLTVPEEVGYQIYNLYDALDFADEDEDVVESNKEVLKMALSLS